MSNRVRVFKAWIEEWEEEGHSDRDYDASLHYLRKYGDLSFEDGEKFVICGINMQYISGKKKDDDKGWHIIGGREDYDASNLKADQARLNSSMLVMTCVV